MVTFVAFVAGLCIGMLAMGVYMLVRFGSRTVAPVQPMRPMQQPAQVPTVIAPHPYDMGRDGYALALPIEEPSYLLWPDEQRREFAQIEQSPDSLVAPRYRLATPR